MAEFTVRLEDEFADGATLGDIANAEQLKVESTPALLANGQNPNDQNYRPIPEMQQILPIAFAVEEDSDPQIVEIIPGQQYAAVDVTKITASAPPPLAQIEQLVTRDYMLDQGSKKAKVVADKIAKAVSGGASLSKAVADAGVKLPRPERRATRAQFKQVFGNEYTAQFISAMKADIGVKRNDDSLAAVKNQLLGGN